MNVTNLCLKHYELPVILMIVPAVLEFGAAGGNTVALTVVWAGLVAMYAFGLWMEKIASILVRHETAPRVTFNKTVVTALMVINAIALIFAISSYLNTEGTTLDYIFTQFIIFTNLGSFIARFSSMERAVELANRVAGLKYPYTK